MSLQRIVQRVQDLMEDRGETWCDKDYVQGFLAIKNEDLQARLEAQELSYLEDTILLSSVPANTSNLSDYQAEGHELDDMMAPITVEWRRVGESDEDWKPARRVDKVTDTPTASQTEGVMNWSWKKGLIAISKSSIDVDLRVDCELLPDVLQADSDNYIKGMTNVLAYWTAELIARSRGGAKMSLMAAGFHADMNSVLNDVETILTKQEHQNTPRRLGGRRSRTTSPLWRPPMG